MIKQKKEQQKLEYEELGHPQEGERTLESVLLSQVPIRFTSRMTNF